MIKAIVAHDKNGLIGNNNALPWHVAADLKYFKDVTMGHALLMGRKTFESIGKVLPGRTSIVVTRDPNYKVDHKDVIIIHDLKELLDDYVDMAENLFIIGGASIYEQALPMIDELHISLIDGEYEGDTYFPEYETLMDCVSEVPKDDFTLKIYKKRS